MENTEYRLKKQKVIEFHVTKEVVRTEYLSRSKKHKKKTKAESRQIGTRAKTGSLLATRKEVTNENHFKKRTLKSVPSTMPTT